MNIRNENHKLTPYPKRMIEFADDPHEIIWWQDTPAGRAWVDYHELYTEGYHHFAMRYYDDVNLEECR